MGFAGPRTPRERAVAASHLSCGSVGQPGGRRWAQNPSAGLSCFNSLDLQSRESAGWPERTSGQNDWQGLKASSETDLAEEGDLERNGVLRSAEKHPGGLHGAGAVNPIARGGLSSVLAVWLWGQAGLEVRIPQARTSAQPPLRGSRSQPTRGCAHCCLLVDRPLCCLFPTAGSGLTEKPLHSLAESPHRLPIGFGLLEWGCVCHQCTYAGTAHWRMLEEKTAS